MTHTALPFFLLASCIAHSAVLLQAEQTRTFVGSSAGTPTLQVRIVKPATKTIKDTAVKIAQASTPVEAKKTIKRKIRPAVSKTTKTMTPVVTTEYKQVNILPRQIPAAHQINRQRFDASLARDKIGQALEQRLTAEFNYPLLARKRGWQGNVMLSLRVEKNGQLSNIKISKTSGHTLLDNSALDSAQNINALPVAVKLLQGNTLTVQIPVHYKLLGG